MPCKVSPKEITAQQKMQPEAEKKEPVIFFPNDAHLCAFTIEDVRRKVMEHYPHFTPLTLATHQVDYAEVQRLIAAGEDVNENCGYGWAPIHLALGLEDETIAWLLLKQKDFKVNQLRQGDNATPLMYAVLFEHQKLAKKLLEMHADLNLKDTSGETVFDYLKMRSLKPSWLQSDL